jgi:hypothetical protein
MPRSSAPPAGTHLFVRRTLYEHHGISAGSGRVIHFAPDAGVATFSPEALRTARIRYASLDAFAEGEEIEVDPAPAAFSGREVVARARARLGERGYDPVAWNCEHFARWCRTGRAECFQVDRVVRAADVLDAADVAGPRDLVLVLPTVCPRGRGWGDAARGMLRPEDRERHRRPASALEELARLVLPALTLW